MSNITPEAKAEWADSIVFQVLKLKDRVDDNEEVGLELVRMGLAKNPDEARSMVWMTIEGYWRVERKRQGISVSSNFEDDPIFLASVRWFRKQLGVEKFQDEMTTAELVPLLADERGTVQTNVIHHLSKSDDKEVATKTLLPLLNHSDFFVQFSTFYALVQLQYLGILEIARAQLQSPTNKVKPRHGIPDNTLIRPSIEAVEKLGSDADQELILEFAFHPHTAVRLRVIEALTNLKHPKSVEIIRKLLTDKRETFQRPKEVIKFMGKPDRVCDKAHEALEQLEYRLTWAEKILLKF